MVLVAEAFGLLAFEVVQLRDVRSKRGVVVGRAGFDPGLLSQDRSSRQLFDEQLGQLTALRVIAAQLADRGPLVATRIGGERTRAQFLEPLPEPRIGPAAMHLAGNERHLLGPVFSRGGGHVGPLIPTEERLDGFEQGGLTSVGAELVERGHCRTWTRDSKCRSPRRNRRLCN